MITVFDQKSPVHTVLDIRGVSLALHKTKDGQTDGQTREPYSEMWKHSFYQAIQSYSEERLFLI